jgi:tRNA pseudouridine55 synthase
VTPPATPCGILLLDKPLGLSSNAALQRARRVFGGVKAGHTGSLDPLATGMLPICLGEATKLAGELLEGDKTYAFTLRLGESRATGDREGEVTGTAPVPADHADRLRAALPAFTGPVRQVPPMYSALKQGGEPLYRLARRGETAERAAREVHIRRLELKDTGPDTADFEVTCSKGTYVRTLGEDLAVAIGTLGHLAALRRLRAEPFPAEGMITLEALQGLADPATALFGADVAVRHLPAMTVGPVELARLRQGQRLRVGEAPATGRVRLYDRAATFLGLGEILPGGVLHPRRLFNGLA